MGLFDFLKSKPSKDSLNNTPVIVVGNRKASPNRVEYADSRSISADERPYYRVDTYYTTYSYPGTEFARKVITFDERKKMSYPSPRGLYVAEILLLDYCDHGKYPKPSGGYPGFWWFEYGIRDIGHALESLEQRGFLQWAPLEKGLSSLKVDELKRILESADLSVAGKKADLIKRISTEIPHEMLKLPDSACRYELTAMGKDELLQNGYVPYMHKHPHKTTEDDRFGDVFNVWSINKLFSSGGAADWRKVVGSIEENLFGVDTATAEQEPNDTGKRRDYVAERNAIRAYLAEQKGTIDSGIHTSGDGYAEESKGLDLKRIGKDKEALVQFYIAIEKKFDAPALYREAATLLEKYEMFDEELYVIDKGLRNIPKQNRHREELMSIRMRVQKKLEMVSKN